MRTTGTHYMGNTTRGNFSEIDNTLMPPTSGFLSNENRFQPPIEKGSAITDSKVMGTQGGEQNTRTFTADKSRLRRCSYKVRPIDQERETADHIGNFEISIASQEDTNDDWIGEVKMLNLKSVRNRNYMTILTNTNKRSVGRTMDNKSFKINRDALNFSNNDSFHLNKNESFT